MVSSINLLSATLSVILLILTSSSRAFSPTRMVVRPGIHPSNCPSPFSVREPGMSLVSSTSLWMVREEGGPGVVTQIGIVIIMILFVATGIFPMLDGGGRDFTIADSVVTQQDAPGKLQNFASKQDRLSRATIQEKLSGIPVFYAVDGNGNLKGTDFYVSYEDVVTTEGSETTIKATSLDQIMYPLILKRGRMRMAPPPIEIERAEKELSASIESGQTPKSYHLISSKVAIEQAKELNLNIGENDLPLFVADRLAFAGPSGPQLPLFTDKADCMLSYQRLRGGRSSLPEQPTIRTATLLGELDSMEKGTRPGVSQLAFYATAGDVEKASQLVQ